MDMEDAMYERNDELSLAMADFLAIALQEGDNDGTNILEAYGYEVVDEILDGFLKELSEDYGFHIYRVKNADEVFTLKWFAEFINTLDFDDVLVDDPHSNVSAALLDRVKVYDAQPHIQKALDKLDDKNVLLCYPDEGAAKRYSSQAGREYVFCIKHRDWRTGKIERLELTSPEKVTDRNVLIVDDICSRGGTFTFTAKALKEAGANEVYLYVTHCENTIHSGTVLTDGLISRVFTTDSIYRGNSEMISLI